MPPKKQESNKVKSNSQLKVKSDLKVKKIEEFDSVKGFDLDFEGEVKTCASGRSKDGWSKSELLTIAESMNLNIAKSNDKTKICKIIFDHMNSL